MRDSHATELERGVTRTWVILIASAVVALVLWQVLLHGKSIWQVIVYRRVYEVGWSLPTPIGFLEDDNSAGWYSVQRLSGEIAGPFRFWDIDSGELSVAGEADGGRDTRWWTRSVRQEGYEGPPAEERIAPWVSERVSPSAWWDRVRGPSTWTLGD